MAVAVDRARRRSRRRRTARPRNGLQRLLVGLQEVRPDLLARGAVDPEPRDGAVPAAQEGVLLLEALEPAALERVVLDVAAAALLLAVLPRRPRARRAAA